MKILTIAIVLTVINLVLMTFLLAQLRPAQAQQTQRSIAPLLRGRGLEIVDSLGRLRATLAIHSASVHNGKTYPEGILLRLIDTHGKPVVKIGASSDGGAMNLSDPDQGYIQFIAREDGSFIKIKNQDGKEQVMKP